MNIEQYKDVYFNYLVDEVIKALSRADKYKCMDFDIVRLDLLINLNHMLDNRKDFEERIKILTLYDKKR